MARRRVGILISGRGSNMDALIRAAADPAYPAEVAIVISNRPEAAGLDAARAAGVSALGLDHRGYADKASFEQAMTAALEAHGVELVCLAGFMRLLSPWFIDRWMNRLVNIHPSLLPAYRGLDTHARALADGAMIAGCTVHAVRSEVDAGPIVAQAVVPVLPDDDAERLAARVLAAEHRLYPHALALLAAGAVRLEGERAVFAGARFDAAAIMVTPALSA